MNDNLYDAWLRFKNMENEAKRKRLEIEEKLLEFKKDELKEKGSKSFKEDNLKITIKTDLNYKFDSEKYFSICKKIPERLRPVKFKIDLDIKEYEKLKKFKPEFFKIMQQCVEIKPSKPYFKIEEIE